MRLHHPIVGLLLASLTSFACAQDLATPAPLPLAEESAAVITRTAADIPAPTPTPTPAPESTPAPLPNVQYSTPFSLNDCINVLGAAVATLPDTPEAGLSYERASYKGLLNSVSTYLKSRDDLHFTWLGYQWEDVARKRVTSGLIEQIQVTFEENDHPRNVTAISFVVENADVYLHSLKVYDYKTVQTANELTDENAVFTHKFEKPIIMRHSLPKLTFFHLLKPTDIGMVDMAVSRVNPDSNKTPRTVIRMGRTNKPEYVKLAIWEIMQAEKALDRDKYIESRKHIEAAQTQIRLLRNSLRLTQ